MSLLSISQHAAEYAGVNVPAAIVGNSDEDAVRLFAIAKQELSTLSRRHNWTVLQRLHTFDTVADDSDYALPGDFDHFISNTIWNRTEKDPSSGPTTNQVWQEWQSGILTPVVNDNWRIFPTAGTNEFHITPTPSAVETFAFEYITSNFAVTASDSELPTYLADTDMPRISEHLVELGMIWRLLSRIGMQFAVEHNDYEDAVNRAIARDGGNRTLTMGGRRRDPMLAAYTPESGFG